MSDGEELKKLLKERDVLLMVHGQARWLPVEDPMTLGEERQLLSQIEELDAKIKTHRAKIKTHRTGGSMSDKMKRRHLWIDDELYAEVVKAAAQQQLETGKLISVAEWIRYALHRQIKLGERRQRRRAASS